MTEKNTNQNIITVASIIVALIAIVYAVMAHCSIESAAKSEQRDFEVAENNPIALIFEGREVTRMEILNNFTKSNSQLPAGTNLESIYPLIQQQYLIGELLTSKAKDAGIGASHPKVALAMLEARTLASRAAYIDKIGEDGLTEEDLQNAYNDIIANSPDVTERKARHILVKDIETANAALMKAKAGKDFAELAKTMSTGPSAPNGGDLGYFTKDEMVKEFSKAAFATQVGSVYSKPVKTQFGYHVIKVEEERTRPKPTLNQVRDQLATQLKKGIVSEAISAMTKDIDAQLYDFNGQPIEKDESEATAQPEETPAKQAD